MTRTCLIALLLLSTALAACGKHQTQPETRRYHLKGKVISIDKQSQMTTVDSEAIPGFMGAMAMPYEVKPEGTQEHLVPGDSITADVVVQDENYWLENVTVSHAPQLK